jgi:A/G-specific adenine glycosylase
MDRNKWISSHYPKKAIKKAPQEQSTLLFEGCYLHVLDYITAVISRKSEHGLQYLLVQRPDTGLLAGLWDFPNIPLEDNDPEDSLSGESLLLSHLTSLGLANLGKLSKKGSSLHIFTHIRRTSQVYSVQVGEVDEAKVEGVWATEEEIAEMAVSELGRKVLRLALGVEKKRKQTEKVKVVSRKVVKLEKGQTKLAFATSQKIVSRKTEVEE